MKTRILLSLLFSSYFTACSPSPVELVSAEDTPAEIGIADGPWGGQLGVVSVSDNRITVSDGSRTYSSTTAGETFFELGLDFLGLQSLIRDIAEYNGVVWVATEYGLHRSDDGGRHLTRIHDGYWGQIAVNDKIIIGTTFAERHGPGVVR
ncbi:MAG: hypothetical protein AAFV29_18020, partial [Myxococcota bacterium]